MQETKFDVWSPVDNKSLLSRLFWIMGTLVSLVLLLVSLCVENVVLSVADGFLPLGIILYGLIKRKKFPIYYYTTCLSGLYPIIWFAIQNCDYTKEISGSTNPPIVTAIVLLIFVTIVFVAFRLGITPRGVSISKDTINKTSAIFKLDKLILLSAVLVILGAQMLNLNFICDKSLKTEWVYLENIENHNGNMDVFYTKPNSDTQYQIKLNEYKPYRTFDWISINQNGEKVFQIEYGNGALGIPWRRIVGNK